MEISEIGEIEFFSGDLNKELTIKEYLKELICTLWEEEESFSGRRPLGNSGWQYDVINALIKNGVVSGELDEDGCAEEFSHNEVDAAIRKYVIEFM